MRINSVIVRIGPLTMANRSRNKRGNHGLWKIAYSNSRFCFDMAAILKVRLPRCWCDCEWKVLTSIPIDFCFFPLVPEEARKPDTSVLQHAAEQLWSKLKVDAASATGLGSSLVACSSNGLTTTTDAPCQPRTILANLLIITAGKSIFPPDHSTMLANSAGSTFPIKFGILTQSSSTPSKPLEGTEMRAKDIEVSAVGDAAGADCGSSPTTSGSGTLMALSTSGSAHLSSCSSSSPLLSSQLSSVSLSPSSSLSPPESASLIPIEPTAEVTKIKLGSTEPTVTTVTSSAAKTEAVGPVVYRGPEIKSEPKDQSADSPHSGDFQPAPARTGQYTCFTCRQHFQSHTGLKRHNLALHVTQILPCDQCVKVFR